MEVWALEGHSAWHILDECLAIKSDEENLRIGFKDFVRGTHEKVQKVRTYLVEYFKENKYSQALRIERQAVPGERPSRVSEPSGDR